MQLVTILATALLAAAPAVTAMGNAVIYNKCDFDVYLWSVSSSGGAGDMITLSSGGKPFTQGYEQPSSGGMSLKLANTPSPDIVTQFEYTVGDNIYYDISNINCNAEGCPFQNEGLYLESSSSGCPTVSCPASQSTCSQAYNEPNDVDTLACALSADLTLYLCADSAGSSSSKVATTKTVEARTSGAVSAQAAATPSAATTSVVELSTSALTTSSIAQSPTPTKSSAVVATTTLVTVTTTTSAFSWGGYYPGHAKPRAVRPRHAHHPHARR